MNSSNSIATMTMYGTKLINAGQFDLQESHLALANNVTISGGGAVTLHNLPRVRDGALIDGNYALTLSAGSLQGDGTIRTKSISIADGATINANYNGGNENSAILLQGETGGVLNAGTMEATNQGILNLDAITINNSDGLILANGSSASVVLYEGTIVQGGTVSSTNGGYLGTAAGDKATLDGATNGLLSVSGTYTTSLGATTALKGLIQGGNLLVIGGSGQNTYLSIAAPTTLWLGNKVTLSTLNGGGSASITGANDLALTAASILGDGLVGVTGKLILDANSTINANSTGVTESQLLMLQGASSITNGGLLQASNNGILEINGGTVNNQGGTISANGSGASVWLDHGAIIQGGTLTNNGGLFLGTDQGTTATLDGSSKGPITINGTYTAAGGSTTKILGTIVNQGTFINNGTLPINSGVTISGSSGAIVNNGNITVTGGLTTSVSTFENNGTISFSDDEAGANLGGAFTNNGTIATGLGALVYVYQLSSKSYSHGLLSGGTYDLSKGGTLQLYSLDYEQDITKNAANILLGGGAIFLDPWSKDALGNLNTITAKGSLSILNGYEFDTGLSRSGFPLSNYGNVTVVGAHYYNATLGIGTGSNMAHYHNYGTTNILDYGFLKVSGSQGLGSVVNESSGIINVSSGGNIGLNINAVFENDGLINSAGTIEIKNHSNFDNKATLNSQGYMDTMTSGTLTNEGSIYNSGTLSNSTTATNSGVIFNSYLGKVVNAGTFNNAGTINNSGSFTASSGTFTNTGTFNNTGAVTIAAGAKFYNQGSGTYLQSHLQTSTVVDGLLSSTTSVQINGGALSGIGTITTPSLVLSTDVITTPGDTIGTLTINGTFVETRSRMAPDILEIAIAGAQSYDQLVVNGRAFLSGELEVSLSNYSPKIGDSFSVLSYYSRSGMFEDFNLPRLAKGEEWKLYYTPTSLLLTVIAGSGEAVTYVGEDGSIASSAFDKLDPADLRDLGSAANSASPAGLDEDVSSWGSATPEPGTFLMMGSGLLALASGLRRAR